MVAKMPTQNIRQLFDRALSIYRDNGPLDLCRAAKRFVVHGSFRNELLNLFPATERGIRLYVRVGRRVRPSRFTDADPLKIVWIDPDEITYNVSDPSIPLRFGKVYGGDWDDTDRRFTDRPVYRCLDAHFTEGVPWDQTEYHRRKRRALERGRSTRGCTTVDDLPDYFARIDALYEAIDTEGYKTQRTLARESPAETTRQNLDAPTPGTNEIGVCIGRHGEPIRGYRGEHRLAIAKLLEIDRVPVQILVRHREWQRVRDRVRAGDVRTPAAGINEETALSSHPDLADL